MQSNNYLGSKSNILQKILSIIFAIAIISLIVFAIWQYMDMDFEETKKEVLANPVYSKGIITAKRTYKGKGADIEYYVEGKRYELKTGITTEFYKHYKVGDTVDIAYSKSNPNLVLLRYELKPSN